MVETTPSASWDRDGGARSWSFRGYDGQALLVQHVLVAGHSDALTCREVPADLFEESPESFRKLVSMAACELGCEPSEWEPPTRATYDYLRRVVRDAFDQGHFLILPSPPEIPSFTGVKDELPPGFLKAPKERRELNDFTVRWVDEIGSGLSGVGLRFTVADAHESRTTDGNGVASVDKQRAGSARVEIADASTLLDAVKSRWTQIRDRPSLTEEQRVTILELRSSELPALDLETNKLRIVSVQPWVLRARLHGGFFDTNKCFIVPQALAAVRQVVKLCEAEHDTTVLIVGHTDSTGKAADNDALSLERADAMKAYLTEDVDTWLAWYDAGIAEKKRWGKIEDHRMLNALPDARTRGTEQPVRWFQRTRGLFLDGKAGPETRRALVTEYMALAGTSLSHDAEVVTHGCGENFPHEPEPDDTADHENRCVDVFLFDRSCGVLPPPPGKNSSAGAKEYPEWIRRARQTRVALAEGLGWLRIKLEVEETHVYQLSAGEDLFDGSVDKDGLIEVEVPKSLREALLTIWPESGGVEFHSSLRLEITPLQVVDETSGVQARLANLNYYAGPVDGTDSSELALAVAMFQSDESLATKNGLDGDTRSRLKQRHDGA